MRILLLGGTGLISVGILKALRTRPDWGDIEVVCFNRGKTDAKDTQPLPDDVKQIHGDRNDVPAMKAAFDGERFDVLIDMIAFSPEQAEGTAALATHVKAKHLIFCSTVCTYGIKIPPGVVVDESFAQEPISGYGKNKLICEQFLLGQSDFATTVIRPSSTYGEGGSMIDNLEFDPPTWSRIREGKPVIIAGDGLGLWNSTHRDDVGKLFAYAAMNEVTFGKCYNATTERVFTWRDYYREAARHFGTSAKVLFAPRDWITAKNPDRFALLREITGYHGAYTSAAAKRDVPEFTCEIDFADGASRTLKKLEADGKLKPAADPLIDGMVDELTKLGLEPVEA